MIKPDLKNSLFSMLREIEERIAINESAWEGAPGYLLERAEILQAVLFDAGLVEEYEEWVKQ